MTFHGCARKFCSVAVIFLEILHKLDLKIPYTTEFLTVLQEYYV